MKKKLISIFVVGGSKFFLTNEKPGTHHVISGQIKGLKKLHPLAQTSRYTSRRTWGL